MAQRRLVLGERLSLKPAAAKLGISHVALWKAEKAGRVTRGEDGLYEVDQCREQLIKNSNPIKQRAARSQQSKRSTGSAARPKVATANRNTGKGSDDYTSILCARERVKLEKAELDLAAKRAVLVDKDAVNVFIRGMIARAQEIFRPLGRQVSEQLSTLSDPAECERVLMAEVRRGLMELSAYRGS